MYRRFADRIDAPRSWTAIAFHAGRLPLALALCVVPALAVLVLATFHETATDPVRVRDAFARYISGLITAATIAVGFATLTLRRGIKGLGELKEHVSADREYAERLARLVGRRPPPGIGATLVILLRAVGARARELHDDALAEHALACAQGVERAGGSPDALLKAALDFSSEAALDDAAVHHRDPRLEELLEAADIGRSYVKTLATQWGIARMSQAIALTSIVAVATTTLLMLAYGPSPYAAGLLAVVTAVVLSPLAVFVSFALRLTFLNQHTLPIGHFVLGPEDPRAARPYRTSRGNRRAG